MILTTQNLNNINDFTVPQSIYNKLKFRIVNFLHTCKGLASPYKILFEILFNHVI